MRDSALARTWRGAGVEVSLESDWESQRASWLVSRLIHITLEVLGLELVAIFVGRVWAYVTLLGLTVVVDWGGLVEEDDEETWTSGADTHLTIEWSYDGRG